MHKNRTEKMNANESNQFELPQTPSKEFVQQTIGHF